MFEGVFKHGDSIIDTVTGKYYIVDYVHVNGFIAYIITTEGSRIFLENCKKI